MKSMYLRLMVMAVLSFISMYVLMYMMVDGYDDVFPNRNELYMASLMTAPMIVIELVLMGPMYKSRITNIVIISISLIVLILCIFFIRQQTAIYDKEFLRSMIPHHGGAVLMCGKNNNIQDTEIRELCQGIISSQQREIDWMKNKLQELEK